MVGPGVTATIEERDVFTSVDTSTETSYFMIGTWDKGPTTGNVTAAQAIRSYDQFRSIAGDRPAYGYGHDDIRGFFDEGGGIVYPCRLVGPAAVKATVTLLDKAGSPLATVSVTAPYEGAAYNDWRMKVETGTTGVKMTLQTSAGLVLEGPYDNLTTPALIAAAFVTLTVADLGSATAGPNNLPANGTFALATGADDRASITVAHVVAAAARFPADLGGGYIAAPGYDPTASTNALYTGLKAAGDPYKREVILAPAANTSKAAAATQAGTTFAASDAAAVIYVYPWPKVNFDGVVRTIPGCGIAAGRAAVAHARGGPNQPPAGVIYGRLRSVVGFEVDLTDAEVKVLNAANVSCFRRKYGANLLYGWRSLSTNPLWAMANYRHLAHTIQLQGERLGEPYVFAPITPQTISDFHNDLAHMGERLLATGQIFPKSDELGRQLDRGYIVDTGPAVNTEPLLAARQLTGMFGFRPAETAEFVYVPIVRVAFAANLSSVF